MSAPGISRRAVAALFLERQWLDRPRARRLTARSLGAFVAGTCGLQIDSVNVVDRAHHLTLWSRFGPYDRARLERLIYRRRVVFEYLSHVACFVATDDLPLWKGVMTQMPERMRRRVPWLRKNAALVDEVARAVAERGPIGNAEFERPARLGRSGGWWSWKPATHALDFLWKSGRIAVHSRAHFHKRYVAIGRVLPNYDAVEPLAPAEVTRRRLLGSLAAMGAARADDLARYWTWPQLRAPELKATLGALVREGAVRELRVEDDRAPWYARAEDLSALARAARRRRGSRGTALLSPFDSLLWHRDRVVRLWDYFYRIEIYVPGHRRTHGYYSLPVLHDGQLVGRVDLKTHREAGVLEARHAHFEPWLAAGAPPPRAHWGRVEPDAALAGLADALHALATHVGATRVKLGRVTPARLRAPLARALAARGG